jgi:beta-glucosidase
MKIDQLLTELTIAEKISLLSGADFWHTEAIERLAIPALTLTDGPHGVRLAEGGDLEGSQPATSFPIEALAAASWNKGLISKMGKAIARECYHYGVNVLLGPGVNGKRSPLGGRNFEYYSEDPYLTAELGTAFVKGVQSQGIGTSVKHFVANEQETNRMVVSSEVSERALREIYFYPFEMIVKKAEPWTVMCSYNKVNGCYMSENNDYLTKVLKEEWNFKGLIMSDWGAVADKVSSLQGGLDLEMPGPGKADQQALAAYQKGELTLEIIDQRVRKVLELIAKSAAEKQQLNCDFEENHKLAQQIAEEGIVLLKNEAEILPLQTSDKIAVIGKFAEEPRFQGGGSSHMTPYKLENPLTAIKRIAEVKYAQGYQETGIDKDLLAAAVKVAEQAEKVILFVGTTEMIESEGYDRKDIELPTNQLKLIKEVARVNQNLVLVNYSGAAVNLTKIDSKLKAVLQAWLPGQAGAAAVANILFGQVNPSGKLSETFPLNYKHNPSYLNFPGNIKTVEYKEGIFVGYRYYDSKELPVKYPFGYGLSYTKFEYKNLELSHSKLKNGQDLKVAVEIKNIGERTGKEIVQLYLQDQVSTVKRPSKELKAFAKVNLKPGESKVVTLTLVERDFAFYSEKLNDFAVESGKFTILVGASSRDIRLSSEVEFDSESDLQEKLTVKHSIERFLNDQRTGAVMKNILQQMGVDNKAAIYPIILGMPLQNLAMFEFAPDDLTEIYHQLGIEE